MPHSTDIEYGERAIPQYERAVALAGGDPVRVALDQTQDEIRKLMGTCDGVLLPGSNADVDPARFHAAKSPHTAAADPRRDAVDDLLLDEAYKRRKPVLGICYGLQSLNVYRGQILTLRHSRHGSLALSAAALPAVRRDQIVLPTGVLERIEVARIDGNVILGGAILLIGLRTSHDGRGGLERGA